MQKIMIIDDEIDILGMLERYFRLNGYIVITAESAAFVSHHTVGVHKKSFAMMICNGYTVDDIQR